MDIICSPIEIRVLGALVEKELTTPEYYPLSLNSLVAACNQKSNRDPVMECTEDDVVLAIESLRGKNLAWQLNTAGGRVAKFEHNLPARLKILVADQLTEQENNSDAESVSPKNTEFNLLKREIAVLCVLMLRGPLTIGEIRGCTGRMYEFKDLSEVEESLQKLGSVSGGGFVVKLDREPGRKESRYHHCFCGIPQQKKPAFETAVPSQALIAAPGTSADRILKLEQTVAELKEALTSVKKDLEDFKKKFE